jgi:NIPSNAP
MFTCFIRYRIEPDKSDEFREYARSWIALLGNMEELITAILFPERTRTICQARLSVFPVWGTEGPVNVAVALFSFRSIDAYEHYRLAVANDEACKAVTARFNEAKCFSSYERTFLVPCSSRTFNE